MSIVYPTLNSKAISCFPQHQHGSIAGVVLFFTALAAALGPLAMAAASDAAGSPRAGFVLATLFAFLLFAGLVYNWLANPARRRLQAADLRRMKNAVQLICYADRLGGTLQGLRELLAGPLNGLFGGVHLLPFFHPIDGADAGFDPIDHTAGRPAPGQLEGRARSGADVDVMADVIVNHVSSRSPQFLDYSARRRRSPYAGLFLTFDSVFPGGATQSRTAVDLPSAPGPALHADRRWPTARAGSSGRRSRRTSWTSTSLTLKDWPTSTVSCGCSQPTPCA